MKRLKHELEAQFGVPVFSKWEQVPPVYETRSALKERGIVVPKSAKPHAIKNSYPTGYFFLFNPQRLTNEPT